MPCSIINKTVQMLIQNTDIHFAVTLGAEDRAAAPRRGLRSEAGYSALQNPDLSRARLAALMRRARRRQSSAKAQRTYWTAFMTRYTGQGANGNATAE